MSDPYTILGVQKTSSAEDIKKAYRKLAKKYHPDLNPNDKTIEKKFKEITAAYNLLSDPEKRVRFDSGEIDAQGSETPENAYRAYQQAYGGGGAHSHGRGSFDFADIFSNEDVFSRVFKQGGTSGFGGHDPRASARSSEKGRDIFLTLRINFLEAALGTKRSITLPDGRTLSISIPKGTEEGQKLRLKGQGEKGKGTGSSGDVHIEIHVEPHPYFSRKGLNIYLDVPIGLKEAILGEKIQVPTIHGSVMVSIPPGSNTGQTMRLKGKGVLSQEGRQGDQYMNFKIALTNPTDEKLQGFVKKWEENPSPEESIRKIWNLKK